MKEATGEGSMTIITIVIIVALAAAAAVIVGVMMNKAKTTSEKADTGLADTIKAGMNGNQG